MRFRLTPRSITFDVL